MIEETNIGLSAVALKFDSGNYCIIRNVPGQSSEDVLLTLATGEILGNSVYLFLDLAIEVGDMSLAIQRGKDADGNYHHRFVDVSDMDNLQYPGRCKNNEAGEWFVDSAKVEHDTWVGAPYSGTVLETIRM